MKHVYAFPVALLVLAAGCASTSVKDSPASTARATEATTDESADETDAKRRDLDRKLAVARAKLEVARLEAEAYEKKQEASLRHAAAEVALAEARLARFREADAPNRLANEQLSLRTAKDRAQEAADELAQIEIMYEDQDLDDVTAEFVVSRGRRSAARAAARIEIMEAQYAALEERELPQDAQRFELELDKARSGLEAAQRDAEIGRHGKRIAVQEAENAIRKLEEELADLDEEQE